jgi:CelD/BcsL family acetyltransferase involved in cellulose biosynthesis
MLSAGVVGEDARIDEAFAAWDELAVAAGRPYCAPAWMLAWWRHLRPHGSALRLVLVHDGPALVGVLPCFVQDAGARAPVLRLLCAGFTARAEPLAVPGREPEVAVAAAVALAGLPDAPGMLALEGLPAGSPWPRLLQEGWPNRGGAGRHRDFAMPAPMVDLGSGDYDAWLSRRSGNFRSKARRVAKRIAAEGATVRPAEVGELEAAAAALMEGYRARWDPRGGSERTTDAVRRAVIDAGRALGPQGRLDIWLLEAEGRPLGAQLFVRAGEESAHWGGGFLPEASHLAPGITLMLAGVEHAARSGVRRVDLGEGAQPHKLQFADRDAGLEWSTLFPRGRHYPAVRARAVPRRLRWWARDRFRRLPSGVQQRVKRAVRRD